MPTAGNSRPRQDRPRPSRRLAVGVGAWLFALAIVPLVGAGWFAVAEARDASRERALADAIDATVQDLVSVTELGARLIDEKNWVSVSAGIAEVGLTPDFVEQFTGFNAEVEEALAVARVNEVRDGLRLAGVADELAAARQLETADLDLLVGSYERLDAEVGAVGARILDQLLRMASGIDDGANLVDTVRVLESAGIARHSMASQLTEYFGAQFALVASASEELESLIEQRELRRRAVDQIERLAPGDGMAVAALEVIEASPSQRTFDTAATDLVTSRLNTGTVGDDSSVVSILADIDGVAAVFAAGTDSGGLYLTLAASAGADVAAASQLLSSSADSETDRVAIIIGLLVAASLLFALGLSHAITRPMRSLARAAQRLRDGDTTGIAELRGPREVRHATEAINEASAHLHLAERQATALAAGDLEHPALHESASGILGSSLQEAVSTLATSLGEREEFRRRLAHEASHDGLTQLPNRRASLAQLRRGLARTRRTDSGLAVMFVDLDEFKDLNDSFGHAAGDAVLTTVGRRLVNAVREGDHVGRLGGDEFVVVAEPVDGVSDAVLLAQRILDAVCEPVVADGVTMTVSASIGIALTDGTSDLTADELLRDSDLAVYKAKDGGKARIELCDEDLRADLKTRTDMEHALRRAVDSDQLTLRYQPIIDSATLDLVTVEALVRWNHPVQGFVMPDEFIPLAERSDLIIEIDLWVVEHVARQLAEWSHDAELSETSVAVNVSARHLSSDHFVADILGPLAAHGVDPSRVIIEVTESTLLQDLQSAAVKLQELRRQGILIAIDDFGTGYTSLAHLKMLPIDILKIDCSFTTDMGSLSLVKLIIDIGHLLGAKVTAEGIESHEQAEALTNMGTDELQGFLCGRPCPPAGLKSLSMSETTPAS